MKTPLKQLLTWTPRILCILFAAFISIFALDVFDEAHGFWQTTLALLIHLIPTWIVLVVLAFSWRWEWVGGILFTALGALYLIMSTTTHSPLWSHTTKCTNPCSEFCGLKP